MIFKTPIEVSARHLHLSLHDCEKLFGKNYKLTKLRDISQPGEFAAQETVVVKTEKSGFEKVRIVGPLRKKTQVEISKTDAYKLGINPPLRQSGDLKKSVGCLLIGRKGKVNLKQGVIISQRHLHIDNLTAKKFGLRNNQSVSVKINSLTRPTTFYKVIVRVADNYKLGFHLDTDEANAAGVDGKIKGDIQIK
jgi:putative phosphotransacetylase